MTLHSSNDLTLDLALGESASRVDLGRFVVGDPHYSNAPQGDVGLSISSAVEIVLSFDEKSQIQALEPTQPSLPMKQGRVGTMTHDYKRNGTTTLFAALNIASGQLIGKCFSRHRHEEFLVFLRLIDREVEKNKQIHIILDNYATHKHEGVRNWLAKHKRFHLHFTPTSSSWLNLVERWFRDVTTNRIRRASFGSVVALIDAIEEYIAHNDDNPKPFIWTKTAGEIITKVRRGPVALEAVRESRAI